MNQLRFGSILVGLAVAVAVLSLVWTPHDPNLAQPAVRLADPSLHHVLGTDRFGRDIASRIMAGAQITVLVSLVAVCIAALIGVPLGVWAGMKRGRFIDHVIMRGSDLLLAFPALLLAIIAGAIWGPSSITAMMAIGVAGIPAFARVARSGTFQAITQDYIAAARVSRVPEWRIALRHVAPNIAGLVIVQATIFAALAILAEAGLSYLGLGATPPTASWGRMLQDAQSLLGSDPLQALWPGLAIAGAVLGCNLLGDALRDFSDPRLKEDKK
ncbi:ABC transporter permease subunit [Corynebacterium flavescens]|uniref:ABC transporter permease subunit n=1 Tax=Corynebacterium flavescens TaxID=28028 RepID=UPI000EDA5233|nr:peptide ABC transporter permease [Corynebacterium flavescens]